MRTFFLVWLLVATVLPAGCADSVTGPGPVPARTVRVGTADSGRTVRLNPGDVVEVRLHSTYWTFGPVVGGALRADRPVVRAVPVGRTVPGSGAGTVTVTFHARHRGRATITAARHSCGEAMRCTGGQGHFTLDVVVG